MDEQIKTEWLSRLRSGKYIQGKNTLRQPLADGGHAHCCLGVLCDIFAEDGEGQWDGSNFFYGKDGGLGLNSGDGILPENLARKTGLEANPLTRGGTGLAELNDDGVSFADIADLIEVEL